ncbi:MAG: HigA family addiction module antidote protein [Bdellovibrionales bacterium]|nr:HigA family addiction module antidote protein [Bdellovibrionales bacterium]
MNQYKKEDYPHPGKVLLENLDDIGLSQKAFAHYLGVDADVISDICRGVSDMTAPMALKIARALGTSPRQWLELQMNYSLVNTPKEEYEHIRQLGSDPD